MSSDTPARFSKSGQRELAQDIAHHLNERPTNARHAVIAASVLTSRWMAEHDQQVRASALREAADDFTSSYWPEQIRKADVMDRLRGMARGENGSKADSPAVAALVSASVPKTGAELIAAERARQLDIYSAEHDAGHAGALMDAAICYGYAALQPQLFEHPPVGWPWAPESWKPSGDPKRNLAKSGALAAAAIDSLKRGA
jgi:hypothetical protein